MDDKERQVHTEVLHLLRYWLSVSQSLN